jgi:hypothetical protein
MEDQDFPNLEDLRLDPALEVRAVVPRKIQKRRRHFIRVPWTWMERLNGASGQTYRLALCLLYMDWKDRGQPIKLANGMLRIDGIPQPTKWRALRNLERRGLITIECRPSRSPIIRLRG